MKRFIALIFLVSVFAIVGCSREDVVERKDATESSTIYRESTSTNAGTPYITQSAVNTEPPASDMKTERPTATPGKTPEKTVEPQKTKAPVQTPRKIDLTGKVIGIDPGHQAKSNSEQEPVAPGASETKKKVSSGTQGRWTRVPEYQVNLDVGLKLKALLESNGATVIMTRETNNVDISNAERAILFNDKKTDLAIRLHCNGSENQEKHGAFMLVPKSNPFLEECNSAAKDVIDEFCKATGAKNLGVTVRSDMTGFNWSERMVILIEMGHMTNEAEDKKLSDPEYQNKMAQGIYNGICKYFE